MSSIVWKINSEPLDDTILPHNVHVACTAFHPTTTTSNRNSNDPECIYSMQHQPDHFKFKLIRFYHQITNLFCCAHSTPTVFGNCSVNVLSAGPIGGNSSTGNLLEPTSLTNINSTSSQHNTIYGHHRRFLPRLPNGSGRSNAHHPYGAMFYPDINFDYRPPPPSYSASNQEYRLRMLLYERANGLNSTNNNNLNLDLNTPVLTTTTTTNNDSTINSNTNTTNIASNATCSQTQSTVTTTSTNTFSGLLSNLGSFVSSFGTNQQNSRRTLSSPPPVYRSTSSSLAGMFNRFSFFVKKCINFIDKKKVTFSMMCRCS